MRIAVCDDSPKDMEQIQRIITEYPAPNCVTLYSSVLELLAKYETGERHDIILFDVNTEEENCFSAAIRLREICAKERSLIICVATAKKVHSAFGIADWYLCKPVSREDVHRFIDRARLFVVPRTLELLTTQGSVVLRFRDIFYIEANNSHLVFNTTHGSYRVRATVGEMMTRLPSGMFFRTHRSYIVNLSRIHRYDNVFIYFDSGRRAYISRSRKNGFKEAFAAFVGDSALISASI